MSDNSVPPELPVEYDGRPITWSSWNAHRAGSTAACGRSTVGPVTCKSCGTEDASWKVAGTVGRPAEQYANASWCEACGELIVAVRHDPPSGKWVGRFETIHHVPSSAAAAAAVEG